MSAWTPEHTAILERMAEKKRPDREISQAVGFPLWKVREMRQARGIKANTADRSHWTRRDWLLAGAAGLCEDTVWA